MAYWPCRLNLFIRCRAEYLKENSLKVSAQSIQTFRRCCGHKILQDGWKGFVYRLASLEKIGSAEAIELKITFFSQTPLSCFVPTFLVEEQLACHMLAVIGCCGVVVSGWWPLRGCGILCALIGLGAHSRPTATHSVHAVSTS